MGSLPRHPNYYKKNLTFFSHSIRMSGQNKKVRKSKFYKNKKTFKIDNIDVNKILVPKKEPHGSNNSINYFTGYNDNNV